MDRTENTKKYTSLQAVRIATASPAFDVYRKDKKASLSAYYVRRYEIYHRAQTISEGVVDRAGNSRYLCADKGKLNQRYLRGDLLEDPFCNG